MGEIERFFDAPKGALFDTLAESVVLMEAPSALLGERGRELVAEIDEALPRLQRKDDWLRLLAAAIDNDDALTAAAAAVALVRYGDLLAPAARRSIAERLGSWSAESADDWLAARGALLGVALARSDPGLRYLAADSLLRRRPEATSAVLGERVVLALSLYESAFPDDTLIDRIADWTTHPDALTQAEAAFQLGRARVRRALRVYPNGHWDEIAEAQRSLQSAATVEDRSDARLWALMLDLFSRFRDGAPAVDDIREQVESICDLALERMAMGAGSGYDWRVWEDHLIMRAAEQMKAAADRMAGIGRVMNPAEPLLSLGQAAASLAAEAAELGLDAKILAGAVGFVSLESSATSFARVDAAREKLEDAIASESDPAARAYFGELHEAIGRIRPGPKAEGGLAAGRSPATEESAEQFLRRFETHTGSVLGDQTLIGLIAEIDRLGAPDNADARHLLLAALECVVGFVVDRTNDPENNLRFEKPDYWRAKPAGPGEDTVEDDVRMDLFRHIRSSPYAHLLSKEEKQMGGRTDVRLEVGPGKGLTIETKREHSDVTKRGLHKYVTQTQSYVGADDCWGVLLVLDLTGKVGRPDTIRDRFWIDRVDPEIGPGEHPDRVVVAVVSGNRVPPSSREARL